MPSFSVAVFVSLKSILVVELLGLERLTNSFGYMLLFQGFAAAIGPPVAGCLRDLQLNRFAPQDIMTAHKAPVHHASAMGFYFSGASLFIAFLFACPLRWLSRRELPSLSPESMPHPYYGNPAFEFGPGHTALDANIPSLSTDGELHPGSPEFAIGVTHIPDALAAPVGDHTYDPVGVSFTAGRSVDQATNASIQAVTVSDPREDETRPALTTVALSEESVPNQKRRKRKKLPRTGEQLFTSDCSVSTTAVPVMEIQEQEQSVVPTETRMEEANT
ncbi:hypothetical protein AHF37_04375 [Paragonimus kellicotti]|nr:hypothetical protein AHF37_04375 [Paragonimus kellicotti]